MKSRNLSGVILAMIGKVNEKLTSIESGGLALDAGDDPPITATGAPIPEDAIKAVVAVFIVGTADADVIAIGGTMASAEGVMYQPELAFKVMPHQQHYMATNFILNADYHWDTLAQREQQIIG